MLHRQGILHDLHIKNDLLAVEATRVLHKRTFSEYVETNVSFILFLNESYTKASLKET